MKKFEELYNLILSKSRVLLIGHENPDGDAVGSLIALYLYLGEMGIERKMVAATEVPEVFGYLPETKLIERDFLLGDFDLIILLDNGDFKRTGFSERLKLAQKKGVPIVNIDHHPKNDVWKIANLNVVESGASSTGEIIYEFFESMGFSINSEVATALLSGIYYDTGGFLHQNTTDRVLEIASKLMRVGAKHKKIAKSVSQTKSVGMLKLWGMALSRAKVVVGTEMVVSFLTQDEIKKWASDEDVSGLVNLLGSATESKVAMLLYETEDGKIRGSLRSEDADRDVSKLADFLGGGGHKRASGFSFDGKLKKTDNGYIIV